jgi:hypothetical protein
MAIVETLIAAACAKGAKTVAGDVVSLVAAQNPALVMARQFGEAYEKTIQDAALSAYNGVRALLAFQLKRDPTGPEILGLMEEAGKTGAFPARAVRQLEEVRRAPTEERRQMLAAVLYGLPFTDVTDDERDRVDMLVVRLMPRDVDLLNKIDRLNRVDAMWKREVATDPEPRCLALHWEGLRLIQYPPDRFGHLTEDYVKKAPTESTTAFTTLQSAGCIEMEDGFSTDIVINGVGVYSGTVTVTPLGALLLRALRDVCPEVVPRS